MKHNWEYKRLDDVCSVNFGKRIVAKDTEPGKFFVYVGGGPTFTTQLYNREDCMIVSRFAMSPECVRFVKGKFFLNDSGLSVCVGDKRLAQSFVDIYLWNNQKEIYNLGRGAAQKNLNLNRFKEISLPIPPMEVQEQIVAELDSINAQIDRCHKLLRTLDSLATSLVYDTFGDPVTNPEGWETESFSNSFKLKSGTSLSAKDIIIGDFPVYGGNGIVGYHKYFNTKGDNIIIGRVGALCGNVRNVRGEAFITDNAFILTHQKKLNNVFTLYLLNALNLRKYAKAVAQPVISNIALKDITIMLPPLALQEQFATQIEAIEAQKHQVGGLLSQLQTLLDSRMDYWFGA